MSSFNKVIIMGNLTRDPELSYTPNGVAVAKFAIAMNEKYKNGQGEMVEKVHFVDITAWKKTAEMIAEYFKKGNPIMIEGKLTQDRWQDQQSGQNRTKLYVTAERFTFVGQKRDGQGGADAGNDGGAGAPVEEDVPF